MTLEEYKTIGEKYDLAYDDYDECFFIKNNMGNYRFVVSTFKGAHTGGVAWVYYECDYSKVDYTIFTSNTYCTSWDAKGFEEQLKLFFRNYKKAQIEVKTIELEKDFTND